MLVQEWSTKTKQGKHDTTLSPDLKDLKSVHIKSMYFGPIRKDRLALDQMQKMVQQINSWNKVIVLLIKTKQTGLILSVVQENSKNKKKTKGLKRDKFVEALSHDNGYVFKSEMRKNFFSGGVNIFEIRYPKGTTNTE